LQEGHAVVKKVMMNIQVSFLTESKFFKHFIVPHKSLTSRICTQWSSNWPYWQVQKMKF